MYTIKLYDGTVLDNLELNGNNFISNTIIPGSVFENNLKTVEVFDGENTQILTDQFLAANRVENDQRRSKKWHKMRCTSQKTTVLKRN